MYFVGSTRIHTEEVTLHPNNAQYINSFLFVFDDCWVIIKHLGLSPSPSYNQLAQFEKNKQHTTQIQQKFNKIDRKAATN